MLQLRHDVSEWQRQHSQDACFVAATLALAHDAEVACTFDGGGDDAWSASQTLFSLTPSVSLTPSNVVSLTLQPTTALEDVLRLTNCELQSGGALVPDPCRFRADATPSHHELHACTTAYAQKPQTWTSYSTTRKHVQMLCGFALRLNVVLTLCAE
ncbi:hypothetical protein BC830DRAFT_1174712, partial [Chytriomyces sp. MP71]